MSHICVTHTPKHTIAMSTKGFKGIPPSIWNAARAPVTDDVGLKIEGLGQGTDATGRLDGLVEDIHGGHDITRVNYKAMVCDVNIHPMDTLAKRLIHARSRKEWLQKDLAIAADVAVATIGMIETGKRGAGPGMPLPS